MAKDPNAPKRPRPMSLDAVADVCWGEKFRGQGLEDALAVICAEHGGPDSIDAHDSLLNTLRPGVRRESVGSADRGLFMINDYWHDEVSDAVAYDPAGAAREAYKISKGGTVWKEWSTWPSLANRHRTVARQAAERRAARGGSGSLGGTGIPQVTPSQGIVAPGGAVTVGGVFSPDRVIPGGQVGAAVVRPQAPSGFVIVGAKRNIDDLVVGGEVDLTMDEASQITVDLYVPGNDPLITRIGARFQWGAFGVAGAFRSSTVSVDPAASGYKVKVQARSHVLHQMRTPHADPAQSFAPSLVNLSATEYAHQLCAARGIRIHGQGTAVRSQIAPAKIDESRMETEWEVLTRLADDHGFLMFEVDGVLHFGSPEWLAQRATEVKVGWNFGWGNEALDSLERPAYRISEDNTRDEQITVKLPRWRGELVRPGMRLNIRGLGGYEPELGWLVSRVNWPIDAGTEPVSIEAFRPDNLLRPPKQGNDVLGLGGSTNATTAPAPGAVGKVKSSLDFVTLCLAQAGDRYIWGAETQIDDQDPDIFDCSELIQWAAGRVGVTFADGTIYQYRAINRANLTRPIEEASKIRGALLFKFSTNPLTTESVGGRHVAVSLGDGQRTIEAMNPSKGVLIGNVGGRGWTHAGLIPGMDYGFGLNIQAPVLRLW